MTATPSEASTSPSTSRRDADTAPRSTLDPSPEVADVVVIGSGFSGLAAALEAAERSGGKARVLVLEKMGAPGGNSVIDEGMLSVANSPQQSARHIADSPDLLANDMLENGEHLNDPSKVNYVALHSEALYDWTTKRLGVEWLPIVTWAGGHSVPRTLTVRTGSGREIYEKLIRAVRESGVEIRLNAYVEAFLTDASGEVVGLRVREGYAFPDAESGTVREIRFRRGLCLCYGGFGADVAYRMRFNRQLTSDYDTTNQPGATGELWREAERIGCAMIEASRIQCTPWSNPKEKGMGSGWLFSDYVGADYGLWVDGNGNRFVNELSNRKTASDAVLELHRLGLKAIAVGSRISKEKLDQLRPGYMDRMLDRGLVNAYDTLEALEADWGIPAGALQKTVRNFNAMIRRRRDTEFFRPLTVAKPLEEGPWYAAEMRPKVHHCMGGLLTDTLGRVRGRRARRLPHGLVRHPRLPRHGSHDRSTGLRDATRAAGLKLVAEKSLRSPCAGRKSCRVYESGPLCQGNRTRQSVISNFDQNDPTGRIDPLGRPDHRPSTAMLRPSLDTDALFLFRELMRTGSLTRAAAACSMSIGSASRLLGKMRETFGDDLFDRTNHGLIPTPKAKALAPRVAKIVGNYSELFNPEVFAPTDLTRVLRIGCVDNAIFTYLSQSLPPLFEKTPRIGVEFRPILRNFIEQLSTGELDFAVYPTVPPSDVLHSAPLAEDVFVLACSKKHPLARLTEQRPLTAEDFKPYRQVRIATAPAKYDADPWSDTRSDVPMLADNVAVWTPYFISVLQIMSDTELWGAVPFQTFMRLRRWFPDLVILGRPASAKVFSPKLLWHERLHEDPASVWVRSVLLSAAKDLADLKGLPVLEDL